MSTENPASDSWRDPVLRRVAIIGAGAMGCSLAAIVAPHIDTVIVARNRRRAERIASGGVELRGALEGLGRPRVVRSIRDLSDIHPIDLVFIATKTTAIRAVCAAMAPDLLQLPYLVSYQNGRRRSSRRKTSVASCGPVAANGSRIGGTPPSCACSSTPACASVSSPGSV